MAAVASRVTSVNVGTERSVEWNGRLVTTAIWKSPVAGPVELAGVNFSGDEQADRRVHGGPDKAVYAYSEEDYALWTHSQGKLSAGTFGENLTTVGIDLNQCYIGDRWAVGTVVLEVAQPRTPCYKLGLRMGDQNFPELFEEFGRAGCYLRIVTEGHVSAGDSLFVMPTQQPAVRVGAIAEGDPDVATLQLMAVDSRVPTGWQKAAARSLRSQ